jgi:hypothetical protein
MLGNNQSVVLNTIVPSSILKKKHNSLAYHWAREAIAAQIIAFCHIDSKENIAEVSMKPLPPGKFYDLIQPVLFRIPVNHKEAQSNEWPIHVAKFFLYWISEEWVVMSQNGTLEIVVKNGWGLLKGEQC